MSNRRMPGVVTLDDEDGTLTPTGQVVRSYEGVKALVGVVILSLVGVIMSTAWVQVRHIDMPTLFACWCHVRAMGPSFIPEDGPICSPPRRLLSSFPQVMIYCAPALIGYTLLAITLFGMVGGVTFFVGGNTAGGVVTLLLTLFGLSYFRVLKRRVHFASANIKVCKAPTQLAS